MSVTAYIALGSNLGDRAELRRRALQALQERPGIEVTQVSTFHETEPVGGPPGQGAYLSAAARLKTDLAPSQLLCALLEVETQLGRVRGERDGPRTIDLDLLLYGDLVCDAQDLIVPHPRMHERLFVLQPLDESAAGVVHPLQGVTIRELLKKAQPSFRRSERELTGLRALVTGSSSGIGKAIALELAGAGADVLVHCRRSVAAADQVSESIRSLGVRSKVLQADLKDSKGCRTLVAEAWQEWSRIDIW